MPVIAREKIHDVSSIVRPKISKDEVSNAASQGQSGKELSGWVLHGAGRQKYGDDREGWRKYGRDCNCREAPAFKNRIYLRGLRFREPLFQSFLTPFACLAVGKIAAKGSSQRRHDRVIDPQVAMVSGQENGGGVHTTRQRDRRVVDDAQQNQAGAAEMDQPSQGPLFPGEYEDRKQTHLLLVRARMQLVNCKY